MKCTLIYRGSGLLGPLVNIREGYNSRCTSIFKDKLGLFHLASQRGRSRSIYPSSWYTALSSCFLLIFCFSFYTSKIYIKKDWFSLSSCLRRACCLFCFCGCSELRSRWERWRDEHLSSPPFPCCPASRLPACWGDWDAADDAAAGSFLALIAPRDPIMVWFGFLQPGLIFHISNVNAPSNSPPLYFWWNLHHMPLKGMNRLAGMLLFSSPFSVQVVWSGPSPDGGKLSNPETVLCSQNCLTGDNEGLWFFFFFWAAITSRKRRRQGLD